MGGGGGDWTKAHSWVEDGGARTYQRDPGRGGLAVESEVTGVIAVEPVKSAKPHLHLYFHLRYNYCASFYFV